MYAPHQTREALEHVGEEPRQEHPNNEADRRSERDRTHGGKPDSAVGRDAGSGKLFALELVTAQLLWLALLSTGLWLLIH
jgi:hypothetical protein